MELFSKNNNLIDIKNYVDKKILEFIKNEKNEKLKEIMIHSLTDGKRIRPIICYLIFKNYNNYLNFDEEIFSKLILIPELLHNISLIIDDLPCMDNDIIRRGKETTHNKFGVLPSYIAISKIMYNISHYFRYELKINKQINFKNKKGKIEKIWFRDFILDYYVNILHNLLEGQLEDLKFDNNNQDLEYIYKINSNKTAPLFVISFILGYLTLIIFNEDYVIEEYILDELKEVGTIFGFIFQLNDDILDREEDIEKHKNLNLSIHLGVEKSFTEFEEKCILLKKKMENLKLWDNNFKEIIDLLKKRIT